MTEDKIKTWCAFHRINNYSIDADGVIDVDGNVRLNTFSNKILPVQFGTVRGVFDVADTNLASLDGMPSLVGGNFFCEHTHIRSLHNVHKVIKHVGGRFVANYQVTHILGLLLIEGITKITIHRGINDIMNKYLGTGNVIMAQDELIDAGFIEQAKL